MKKITLGLILLAASLPAAADNHFSGELLLGKAAAQTEGVFDFSGASTSIGVRGAYIYNKNLAFELAYQNYGRADIREDGDFGVYHDKPKTKALNLGVKGSTLPKNGTVFNARAGISRWDQDEIITYTYQNPVTGKSRTSTETKPAETGTDFYLGVGLEHKIRDNLSVGVEFTRLKINADKSSGYNISNLSASIAYLF